MKTSGQAPVESLLQGRAMRLIEHAAVLGTFEPGALLDRIQDGAERRAMLQQLAPHCDEVGVGDDYQWRLKPDQRRHTLARLREEQRLVEIAAAARPADADVFGRHLRAALLGQPPGALPTASPALDELRQALQFAAVQVPAARQELASVETQMARQERESATRMLVPRRLVGRKVELERLHEFLHGPDDAPVMLMSITGVGGSGKSALLAEFAARSQGSDWQGTPVVLLDFDRAMLADADGLTLAAELTRQIELFRPERRERLGRFRSDIAALARETVGSHGRDDYDARAALESRMWSHWQQTFAGSPPISNRMLVILDTFEEVLLRGPAETAYLLNWLLGLATEGGVRGLRALISSRASPDPELVQQAQASLREMRIGDLLPDPAQNLLKDELQRLGTARTDDLPLAALVKKFGGHPLLLKVLARYLSDQDPATAGAELLVDRTERPTEFDQRFAQRFLYDRILRRIRSSEPAIHALAHPGLSLRRVSADLIRRVLAAPCKLGKIDGTRADELFQRLREQVWLVERTGERAVVRHRRDLRGLMLQAMEADLGRRAQRIHRRAAGYYHFCLDPYLSRHEQRFECLYHALMGGVGSRWPSLEEVRSFLTYLGEDAEQLPLRSRAKLKFDAESALTAQETVALDAEAGRVYEQRVGSQRRRRGWRSTPSGAFATVADAFSAGEFEAVVQMTPRAIEDFLVLLRQATDSRSASAADLTGEPIWQVAMASLTLGSEADVLQKLLDSLDGIPVDWRRPLRRQNQRGTSCGIAVDMLFALLARPGHWRTTGLTQTEPVHSYENLRAQALLAPWHLMKASPLRVPVGLLRYLEPGFAAAMDPRLQATSNPRLERSGLTISPEDAPQLFGPMMLTSASLAEQDLVNVRAYTLVAESWPLDVQQRHTLCGRLPEIYAAIRGAMEPLHPAVILDYADAMSSARNWPIELRREQFEERISRDRPRWLSTLIECSDRVGDLQGLLDHGAKHSSAFSPLSLVRRLRQAYMERLVNPQGGQAG